MCSADWTTAATASLSKPPRRRPQIPNDRCGYWSCSFAASDAIRLRGLCNRGYFSPDIVTTYSVQVIIEGDDQ